MGFFTFSRKLMEKNHLIKKIKELAYFSNKIRIVSQKKIVGTLRVKDKLYFKSILLVQKTKFQKFVGTLRVNNVYIDLVKLCLTRRVPTIFFLTNNPDFI